jgi:LysR family transcriptional regulator, low CO2-responsive transcriptional regulator
MTPSQARAFLAVASKHSFSEAARSLGVSQPTVTTQIKGIERRYEVELFYRSGRGTALTPVGLALLPFIRRMFESFDEAKTYLHEIQGMHRGHLRIGSYGPYDVTKLVALYNSRFPAVSITVDILNSQSLAEKLLKYDLDIAVLGRMKPQPEFHALPFKSPRLVAIAPRNSRWISRQSISVAELAKEKIICREQGSAPRAAHDRLFAKSKIPPSQIIQFATREGVVSAVVEGIGIGTIFDEGILPHERIVKLEIVGPPIRSHVDIVCLADRRSNKLISSFLGIARELLKQST